LNGEAKPACDHIMIEIASSAAPQLGSLLPLVVRPRRSRSPKDAPADSPELAHAAAAA